MSDTLTLTRVLVGEDQDPRRRGTKKLIAKSECRFVCPDDEILARCVEQIRLSDEHLRSRPADMILWDWQSTYVEKGDEPGGTVVLGVAWYNETFFNERRDAYANPSHLAKYLNIGLAPGAITVTHWKLIDAAVV
jgi:hypothetical protein